MTQLKPALYTEVALRGSGQVMQNEGEQKAQDTSADREGGLILSKQENIYRYLDNI